MLKLAIILAAAAVYCVQAQNNYFLYTRNNPYVPEPLSVRGDLPAVSNFDVTDDTIILIHGHGGSARSPFNTLIRHEIFRIQSQPHNVIVVDWEAYAILSYPVASSSVSVVARDLVDFIKWLTQLTPALDVSRLHLVGFGLGAHVAGMASRQLITPGIVGRITGLDPSGSGWGTNSQRLRHDDAHYVEVIHTDGSGLLANGIGTAIGQINFYANGGSNQPGCFTHSCSHNRAYELFAASMINWNLVGYPCSSNTQMNLNLCRGNSLKIGGTEINKIGQSLIYRINTRRQYPF